MEVSEGIKRESVMERKIRVLMCCSDLESVKGGMVTVVRNYLDYQGFKKSRITFVATHVSGNRLIKSAYFVAAFIKILFMLLLKRVDLVHLHMAERGSFYRKAYIVRLCRRFKIPVIIHHHGAEFEDFYQKLSAEQKKYVKDILEMTDCNLVLSSFLKQKLLEKAENAKVEVLHNAVPVKCTLSATADADRIVMLGCQGKRKGSYDLLDAIAGIDKLLPEKFSLWMCGDEDVEGVREYAEKLGLSHRVAWVGWISGVEKEACLERAFMHVLPSYREGLPMSILETMGRGIPNISTAIASIPEVIRDGENGFLIQPGDVELLQQRILELVRDEALHDNFSRESYRTISTEFSLSASVEKLENIYADVIRDV